MTYVSWHDAVAYAKWVGKRLPTEAEWEYAARGGLSGKQYCWGDTEPNGKQSNYADKNTNYNWSDKNVDDGYSVCAPVGSFEANGYGLQDMAGNVWEWCSDWYDENYYGNSPTKNPTGPITGSMRVLRGGSWIHSSKTLPVAYRGNYLPTSGNYYRGFRCVSGSN